MEWMIQIEPLQNGAHRMQTNPGRKIPPLGYAFIPPEMIIPKGAPFVDIEVAEETRYNEVKHYNEETDEETVERIPYTVTVVTSMTAGVVPERPPEPIPEPTTDEILDVLLGVADDE